MEFFLFYIDDTFWFIFHFFGTRGSYEPFDLVRGGDVLKRPSAYKRTLTKRKKTCHFSAKIYVFKRLDPSASISPRHSLDSAKPFLYLIFVLNGHDFYRHLMWIESLISTAPIYTQKMKLLAEFNNTQFLEVLKSGFLGTAFQRSQTFNISCWMQMKYKPHKTSMSIEFILGGMFKFLLLIFQLSWYRSIVITMTRLFKGGWSLGVKICPWKNCQIREKWNTMLHVYM